MCLSTLLPVQLLPRRLFLNSPKTGGNGLHVKEHVTQQNFETSRLHQLPTELLLTIDEYLEERYTLSPNVSKMAFRATCRRVRTMLPHAGPLPDSPDSPGAVGWKEWDRRAYSQMLRLGGFRELCERERRDELGTHELVCCICQLAHPRACFEGREREKEPECRTCVGARGVLDVCAHIRLTWMGVRVGMGMGMLVCNKTHYSVGGSRGSVRVCVAEGENGMGKAKAKGKEVKVVIELRVLEIAQAVDEIGKEMDDGRKSGLEEEEEEGEEMENMQTDDDDDVKELDNAYKASRSMNLDIPDKIIQAVKKTNYQICPHIHTSSAESWLPPTTSLTNPTAQPRHQPPHQSNLSHSHSHKCKASNCSTLITFLKERNVQVPDVNANRKPGLDKMEEGEENKGPKETKEYLVMKIERCLGVMERADDEMWMAQIVKPDGDGD